MEKFDIIVLMLDENSSLLDESGHKPGNSGGKLGEPGDKLVESGSRLEESGRKLSGSGGKQGGSRGKLGGLMKEYALAHATLVVIFIGEKANRIIAGQQAGSIATLPGFDASEGRNDAAVAIQSWIYESQANMYSGSAVRLRTGIFVDISEELIKAHRIEPAKLIGNLTDTEYFNVDRQTNTYNLLKITKIEKLEALAKTGDSKALYELGLAYVSGDGVKKNEPRGQMLLYKAYLRGNIDAIFALVDLIDEPDEHFCKEAAKHR